MKKYAVIALTLLLTLLLSACGNNGDNDQTGNGNQATESPAATQPGMDHEGHHGGSSEIPAGLQDAKNPKYPVGSEVTITEGHMPGMKGAQATVSGAFDTTVYTVSYNPTTGGERVTNHKWVIHEELKEAGDKPFSPGDEVTIEANHMPGMQGAKAVIDKAEKTTIYMVDYTPTTGGERVTNHMWVTETELAAR